MNILEFDKLHGDFQDTSVALVRNYLVSNGWKYTSKHPGSIWLWTFEDESTEHVDDETIVTRSTYAVPENIALQIQRYWELEAQHFPSHADDCPIFYSYDWDSCTCMADDPDGEPD